MIERGNPLLKNQEHTKHVHLMTAWTSERPEDETAHSVVNASNSRCEAGHRKEPPRSVALQTRSYNMKAQAYNPFSETSKKTIKDVGNVELL